MKATVLSQWSILIVFNVGGRYRYIRHGAVGTSIGDVKLTDILSLR